MSRVLPYRTSEDRIGGVVLTFVDITERKRAQEEVHAARVFAESIVETLHEPLLVLHPDFRVRSANQAFFDHFEVNRAETEGRLVYELGNGQWDIPALRTLLEEVLPDNNVFNDFEVRHKFEDIGERTMLVNARRLDHVQLILLGIRDITERKRAEEALRASEEQFRRSIEEAPIPVIMHAEDGEVLQISRTWTELTGYTLEEVPTFEAWLTRAYGHGADAVRAHVHALFSGVQRTMSIDFPVHTRDGGVRHWSFSASAPGTLHDGRRFVVGMALDVTERRRAEDSLRESEERLRTVIESIQDYAIITLDSDGRITSWNDGARRMTGFQAEEVLGRTIDRFYPPDDVAAGKPAQELQRAIATGRSEDQSWRVRKDGSQLWVNEIVRPLRDSDGRVHGFAKISRDLTERKAFADALQEAHDSLEARVRERTAEVQSLFTRLVSAQEEEPRRLARDIHDQLGQQITALRMNIATLRLDGDSGPAAEQVKRAEGLAEELDRAIDFLTWELRPAALDRLGLPAALAHLVSGWSERFHIHAEYDTFGLDGARFPSDVETNLYRLTQEALHNVYKHAHATRVSVLLEKRDGRLALVVEDDGEGFTPGSQKGIEADSFGLINMRERATLAGGELTIDSIPGHGTTLIVRVPLGSENGRPDDDTETAAR